MIKILLDPGHGAGATHNRGGVCFNEGDNNFHYSLVLKSELEKYESVQVGLTRTNINQNPNLQTRAAMGKGYDLFWSIHSNAGGGGKVRGTEVWDSVEKPNKTLATKISSETAKMFGHNDRGVKYRVGQPGVNWYGVLRFNGAKSAMIIENGFHDNSQDCAFFKNNHQLIAETQARVIAQHYSLKRKGGNIVNKPVNTAPNQTVANWAKESWDWSKKEGLLDGTRPKDNITREEFAMVLFRLHKSGKLK